MKIVSVMFMNNVSLLYLQNVEINAEMENETINFVSCKKIKTKG